MTEKCFFINYNQESFRQVLQSLYPQGKLHMELRTQLPLYKWLERCAKLHYEKYLQNITAIMMKRKFISGDLIRNIFLWNLEIDGITSSRSLFNWNGDNVITKHPFKNNDKRCRPVIKWVTNQRLSKQSQQFDSCVNILPLSLLSAIPAGYNVMAINLVIFISKRLDCFKISLKSRYPFLNSHW